LESLKYSSRRFFFREIAYVFIKSILLMTRSWMLARVRKRNHVNKRQSAKNESKPWVFAHFGYTQKKDEERISTILDWQFWLFFFFSTKESPIVISLRRNCNSMVSFNISKLEKNACFFLEFRGRTFDAYFSDAGPRAW